MDVVYRRCCGLDIHNRTVVACLLLLDESGQKKQERGIACQHGRS